MNFDHERPNALIPNEWEYQVVMPNGATVLVSKVGGGTLGREYDGWWHWSWTLRDQHDEGSDLQTGSPHDHANVAALVDDWMGREE